MGNRPGELGRYGAPPADTFSLCNGAEMLRHSVGLIECVALRQ